MDASLKIVTILVAALYAASPCRAEDGKKSMDSTIEWLGTSSEIVRVTVGQNPLFISFTGRIKSQQASGWVVFTYVPALRAGKDIENLCRTIETERGYDAGTVVIANFLRLEK